MGNKKKIVDLSKLCADIKPQAERSRMLGKRSGINNTSLDDVVPTYERANVENTITLLFWVVTDRLQSNPALVPKVQWVLVGLI